VKTGDPNARATANCKLCKLATALHLGVIRELVTKMLMTAIIRNRTRYFRDAYPNTDNTLMYVVRTGTTGI
jgi:hypothetical protein